MKKQIVILCTLVLSACTLTAQNKTTGNLKSHIAIGAGIVPTFVADGAATAVPPITFKAGYQLGRQFSLSGFFGYTEAHSKPSLVSDGQFVYAQNTLIVAGIRGEWKKPLTEKFDVYGGGMLGIAHSRLREFDQTSGQRHIRQVGSPSPHDPNAANAGLFYTGFVGGQYFFRKNLGLFLEAGFGISLLNTGVVVRL